MSSVFPSNIIQVPVYEKSVTTYEGTLYCLAKPDNQTGKKLVIVGNTDGFTGEFDQPNEALYCPLTPENAALLRQRLPWLRPSALGLRTSAGFGDRLGVGTPGHIHATQGTGVAPIFAQQSVRENTRTGRTPQQVVDDAMWGVFQEGWREVWGADGDHLKNISDIAPFVAAGYTFFTIDPSAYVDDAAEHDDPTALSEKVAALPWDKLHSSLAELSQHYLKTFNLDTIALTFTENLLLKALAKYGAAIAHTARMATEIKSQIGNRPFDLEMSVDETGTTTSLYEHFYIASELKRLDVPFVSLAPRFVGRFEKGVDYIGDLAELDQNIAGHAAIMRHFGNSYKLSLHTGSDKFGVYPIAMRHTQGLVHLKTAGTSYLEALRMMASVDLTFFRDILKLSRSRYETDRQTYHVSATLEKVPASSSLTDSDLPGLLDQFDARQVLHVTFGSVLDNFGVRLHNFLRANEVLYHSYLEKHFNKHLEAFTC